MATRKSYSGVGIKSLEEERSHIESLFADRINFYLVFAAGVLAFIFDEHHTKLIAVPVLLIVSGVSIVMCLALLRNYYLVMGVLDEIKDKHGDTPYAFYAGQNCLPNANTMLLVLPFALTALFVYLTVYTWVHKQEVVQPVASTSVMRTDGQLSEKRMAHRTVSVRQQC
jgi:hypothetical protein